MKAIASILKAVMLASYDFYEGSCTACNENSAKRFCRWFYVTSDRNTRSPQQGLFYFI